MAAVLQESSARFLTFRVDGQLYALRALDVAEVIRVPLLARVPQGPPALLGIANLRGAVLPVAGVRELLGRPAANGSAATRAIVLTIGAPVAVMVDSVETLEEVGADQIEKDSKELGAEGAEKLLGAFAFGATKHVAKILDIRTLLNAAFADRTAARRETTNQPSAGTRAPVRAEAHTATETLVTFDVAGQEFALPLTAVQEILPAPAQITAVARAEALVLGITSVRGKLLPLLSLRGLLGFGAANTTDERAKVIVMKLGGSEIGLVADRARAILPVDAALVDPLPPVLAARVGGESRIRAIYRGDSGRRLISILSPEQLFREDVMQRLTASDQATVREDGAGAVAAEELILLVFRLADVEFGLPIDAVVEVAEVPARISRIPKTPKFLEGVINLRGEVLPVVDQRRRFDMQTLENSSVRKLVVIRTERHRAGLIVDSVSDVLRADARSVEPAPVLTEEITRLVRGVVNLPKSNRLVLLLDPTELLTRAEQGLLDKFQAAGTKADA